MMDIENTVAEVVETTEQPADDAQAAEVTAEELFASLTQDDAADETVDNGDDGHTQEQTEQVGKSGKPDKFDGRIKAALANQHKKYQPDIDLAARLRGIADGMTDEEIADALRGHQARKMHEADPDISEKAAREIIKAREARVPARPDVEAYRKGVEQLMADGWTADELRAFAADETVREDLANGKTLGAAATAFLRRGAKTQTEQKAPEKRRGVPTIRSTATSAAASDNPLETMSDEEFRKFSARVEEEALAGKKVRF